MKTKSLFVLSIIAVILASCATTAEYTTPSNARIATAFLVGNVLNFVVPEKDQGAVANDLWAIAHGVRTTAGGKLLSPEEFVELVSHFSSSTKKWSYLHNTISTVYQGIYAKIVGKPKAALDWIEALAAGIEDAAGAFRPAPKT